MIAIDDVTSKPISGKMKQAPKTEIPVTVAMIAPDAYSIAGQVWTQAKAVLLTIVWSGVVSVVAFKIVDLTIGLRVTEEEEREGLDISSHGESAYHG